MGVEVPRRVHSKNRRKVLYGALRRHVGELLRTLRQHKGSTIEEGHLTPDDMHMLLSIPPKYAVAQVIGYIKGKSAIQIARQYLEKQRNFVGQNFWARGYFVSSVGRDEVAIREYIRHRRRRTGGSTSSVSGSSRPPP